MASLTRRMDIYGIGRNYAEHAKELGNTIPAEPIVFLKPSSSLVPSGGVIPLPSGVTELHHEVELVLEVAERGSGAPHRVSRIAVGIDVTDRLLQSKLKQSGLPWALAKGQKGFSPLGSLVPLESPRWDEFTLELSVNGEIRQSGRCSEMIFKVPQLMEFLEARFELTAGDLIFTGTPSGVGPFRSGDRLSASLKQGEKNLSSLEVRAL